jgi:hypothetical protein
MQLTVLVSAARSMYHNLQNQKVRSQEERLLVGMLYVMGSSQIMDNQVRYQTRVSDNSYSYDEWLRSPIGRTSHGLFTNGVIGVNLS